MAGYWRGLFVSVDEGSRSAQVFIPMLHKKLMPFNDPSNPKSGVISDLSNYPTAYFACPGVFVTPEVGDACWVVFENGDPNFPIVVGQLGTTLPEGDVTTAIYGGGGGGFAGGAGSGGYLTGCASCELDDYGLEFASYVVYSEGGSNDLQACREYASHMANLVEYKKGLPMTQEKIIATITSGWYAHAKSGLDSYKSLPNTGRSSESDQAVKEVFTEGKRWLPRFVIEFDCFPHDAWNNEYQTDKSKYKQGETEVNQRPIHYVNGKKFGFASPTNYMFWIFFKSGDIGGYMPEGEMYKKYKDDVQKMQQVSASGGGNKAAEEFIKIMNAGYSYGRGTNQYDCSSATCEALYRAGILPKSGKSWSTTSFGVGGKEFLKYGFVDVTSQVWPGMDRSSCSKMQPGDILWCYDEHMTMYVGDGKIGLMSSSKGCRLGNYYVDKRITHVFRHSSGGTNKK